MLEGTYSISCRRVLNHSFFPLKYGISLRISDNYSWKLICNECDILPNVCVPSPRTLVVKKNRKYISFKSVT